MCRLTAILSTKQPVCVGDVVTKPRLSIIYQSFNCHERIPRDRPRWAYEQSTLNGDGFGVGWYVPKEQAHLVPNPQRPCVFTSLKPAWGDRNLKQLADNTISPLIFAHVRAAGPGSGAPTETNCHPFRCGRFLFMHNGVVGQWAQIRRMLLSKLSTPLAFNFAMENTPIDSVVLFALFLDTLDRGPEADYSANELRIRMQSALETIKSVLDEMKVEEVSYMNCMVSDGVDMVATRYAVGPFSKRHRRASVSTRHSDEPDVYEEVDRTQSLSLYFATGTRWMEEAPGDFRMTHTDKRNEVCIVTSEPLTEVREEWVPVPHNHLIIVSSKCDVLLQPLGRIVQASQSPRGNGSWGILDQLVTLPLRPPDASAAIYRSLLSLGAASTYSPAMSHNSFKGHTENDGSVADETSTRKNTLWPPVYPRDRVNSHQIQENPEHLLCRRVFKADGIPILCVTTATVQSGATSQRVLVTGDQLGHIRVWSLETGDCLTAIAGHKGSVLALESYTEQWDTDSDDSEGTLSLPGVRERTISSVSSVPSPTSQIHSWLFSASADTTVGVWNLSKLISNPGGHESDYLSVRLYFEPLQGDVLSLAVTQSPSRRHDYLYIGYQSTMIGYIKLQSLFERMRTCRHFRPNRNANDPLCSQSCRAGRCPIGMHMTSDYLSAPQLVLSAATEMVPDPFSEEVFTPTVMSNACAQQRAIYNPALGASPEIGTERPRGGNTGLATRPSTMVSFGVPLAPSIFVCPGEDSPEHSEGVEIRNEPGSNRFVSGVPAREGLKAESDVSSHTSVKTSCCCTLDWYLLRQDGQEHHCGFVEALAVAGGGDTLISGGGDGLVVVWRRGRHVSTLSGHTGGVLCLAASLSPGGIGGTSPVQTGEESAGSDTVDHHTFYSGARDKSIRVWDLQSLSCRQVLRAHTHDVMALTLTPQYLVSASTAWEVFGWSRRWHDICFVLHIDKPHRGLLGPHPGRVHPIITHLACLNEDSSTIVSTGSDGIVRFWNLASGERVPVESSPVPSNSHQTPTALTQVQEEPEGNNTLGLLMASPRTVGSAPHSDIMEVAEMLLRTFIPIRSISTQDTFANECWRAANTLSHWFDEIGAETQLCPTGLGSAPVVLARIGHDPKKPTVILYSHYDVVPSGEGLSDSSEILTPCLHRSSPPKGKSADCHWNTDPWTLSVVNGYFYGRGMTDNKGPLIAQLLAVAELIRGRYDPEAYADTFGLKDLTSEGTRRKSATTGECPVNIVFISEGEEENGSLGFEAFLESRGDMLGDSKYALFTNTYWLDDETPCLVHGMRGVIDLQVTVSGGDDPLGLHSGIHGGAVVEPLVDALALASSLVDNQGHILVPGFYDDVLGIVRGVSESGDKSPSESSRADLMRCFDCFDLDKYRAETGNAGLRNLEGKDLLRRRWIEPSLSITEVWSSTQTSGEHIGSNFRILPSRVGFNISVRFVPNQRAEKLVQGLKALLEFEFAKRRSPNRLEMKLMKCHDWWQGETTSPLFHSASKAMTRVWGSAPMCTREGGTIPVIQRIQDKLGVATIQIPIGQASDNAHLPNERLRATNLLNGIEVLKMTLWGLGHWDEWDCRAHPGV